MATLKYCTVLALLASVHAIAQSADAPQNAYVASLLSRTLQDSPGKEVLLLTVEYPPGGSDPVHRHEAHAFVYVLEGTIVMQVRGGKQVTLNPGQTFYEGPSDLHTVGKNASTTKPAKFLVFLVKNVDSDFFLPYE